MLDFATYLTPIARLNSLTYPLMIIERGLDWSGALIAGLRAGIRFTRPGGAGFTRSATWSVLGVAGCSAGG